MLPVVPVWVMTIWVQAPVGMATELSMSCSATLEVRMPNRGLPAPAAPWMVRYMSFVPVPKSKTRALDAKVVGFTQTEMVKSLTVLTTPAATVAYCDDAAAKWIALPKIPGTQVGPLTSVAFQPLPLASAEVVP